jgi:glyoxylase-like metal-dependent hydrolase (beta-lactamase superfamily II)
VPLRVAHAVVGAFVENAYVVACERTGEAMLVDPGDEPDAIAALVAKLGVRPVTLVATHGHIDHVGAVQAMKDRYRAAFRMHAGDLEWLSWLPDQARLFGLRAPPVPEVDRALADGDEVVFGDERARVIHTPGHTQGAVCLWLPEAKRLFTGDTLFAGSVGRTDLPGGDFAQEIASIRSKLFPLGDDVQFHPGHGPAGFLGEERRANPFAGDEAVET